MKHLTIYSAFIIFLIIFQTLVLPVEGQTSSIDKERVSSVEISFARTRILGETFPGMSGHYIFFITDRFGSGLSLFSCENQVDQNFGYPIINPQLLLSQYGWLNQFILIDNKYIKFKLNLTNGLIQLRLFDDSQRYYSGQFVFPPKLDRDFYYFIAPGADVSIRLFGPLYITAGINYRYLFGKGHFTDRKELQNTGYSLGLNMIDSKN
jgi:hypothetical protein